MPARDRLADGKDDLANQTRAEVAGSLELAERVQAARRRMIEMRAK
jgi:hypothetical protein